MTDSDRLRDGTSVSVSEVATVCLKESFAELFRCWEAAAGRGQQDPEHVHQLRVASRRATAVLQLFSDHLPRGKTKKVLRQLDDVRKSAGPARDADVIAAMLPEGMRKLKCIPTEMRQRAARQFTEILQSQRAAAQRKLATFYEECERGEVLERAVTELLAQLQPRGKRAVREAADFPRWAARQLHGIAREFDAKSKVDTERPRKLHRFRIRAKQLRYSLEWMQPAFDVDQYEKPHSKLKKLCRRLGMINDRVTTIAVLSRWLDAGFDAGFDAESTHVLRIWRIVEKRALQKALSKFDDWWTGRRRRRFCRLLASGSRKAAGECGDERRR